MCVQVNIFLHETSEEMETLEQQQTACGWDKTSQVVA